MRLIIKYKTKNTIKKSKQPQIIRKTIEFTPAQILEYKNGVGFCVYAQKTGSAPDGSTVLGFVGEKW